MEFEFVIDLLESMLMIWLNSMGLVNCEVVSSRLVSVSS